MAGIWDATGGSPKKEAADLLSEEVPGRGPDCGEPRGARRLGVFGGEGAAVAATAVDSGEGGRLAELCSFFKLSSRGLGLGAGAGAVAAAGAAVVPAGVPAAGRVNVREGCVVGGFSVTQFEAASVPSAKALLNHRSEALFSSSRSSAVME